MKFKVDENLPQELVSDLAEAGHEAETVVKEGMAGVVDSDLLEVTRQEGRILLTLDKGIANVLMFPPTAFPGIVLSRPNSMGRGEVLRFVRLHLHLVQAAGVCQPAVSQHLKVLKDVGLVDERRDGRFRFYRLNAEPLAKVMAWVGAYEQFWTERLAALGRVLDET